MIPVRERIIHQNLLPLVTIFCWTFNDVKFINNAVEGILNQITDFPIEIIINDDASTDGTVSIINNYSSLYPGLFNNNICEENLWSQNINVAIPLFSRPRGKYIALLHGDDYWTDSYKLYKQVKFLEQNESFSFCFHKVNYLFNNEIIGNYYKAPHKNKLILGDILKNHFVATSSVVFRKSMLSVPSHIYQNMYFNDICLEMFLSMEGPIYYFDDIMGVYRKNIGSISNQISHLKKGRDNLYKMYKDIFFHLKGKHFLLILFILIRIKLGYIKDFFDLNSSLRSKGSKYFFNIY
jgi:glycosyltransferase involved in cell wall biosynthesis